MSPKHRIIRQEEADFPMWDEWHAATQFRGEETVASFNQALPPDKRLGSVEEFLALSSEESLELVGLAVDRMLADLLEDS